MTRVRKALYTPGVCACGCGRALPIPRLPARRWASNRCKSRGASKGLQPIAADLTEAQIDAIMAQTRAHLRYARVMADGGTR